LTGKENGGEGGKGGDREDQREVDIERRTREREMGRGGEFIR